MEAGRSNGGARQNGGSQQTGSGSFHCNPLTDSPAGAKSGLPTWADPLRKLQADPGAPGEWFGEGETDMRQRVYDQSFSTTWGRLR